MKRILLLILAGAVSASAATPSKHSASKRAAAKRPARKATAPSKAAAKTATASTARPAAASGEPLDDVALFGLGAALVAQNGELVVASVRPGSRAAAAGLQSGDRLLRVDDAVTTPAKAAAQVRAWTPGTRLSMTVRRGLEIRTLETEAIPPARDYARGEKDLSDHEQALASERMTQSASDGRAVVRAVGPLTVAVRADQGVWIRFPKGLPSGLKKGDDIVAEAAMGLTVDASLDFLAIPPGSKLRARVLEAVDDGETRQVRLAFYALDLTGGGTYATIGAATAVSGDQRLARVGEGGTLVAAAPLPDAKRKAPEPLVLDTDARLRVHLLQPLVIDEPPSYWRAGPGLWIKTVEDSGRRLFELTNAIPGRSAEAVGLKVGDRLDAIGGRSTEKMDFAEAIDRLYGAPGSDVDVSVVRPGKSVIWKLKRGIKWAAGKSSPLPLAYNAQ